VAFGKKIRVDARVASIKRLKNEEHMTDRTSTATVRNFATERSGGSVNSVRPQHRSRLIAALLTFCAITMPAHTQTSAAPPVLNGKWGYATINATGNMFAMQNFAFDGDRWSVKYSAFADRDGKQPLFTIDNSGVYVIGGPSAKVVGAWEGIFPQTRRSIMADSEAGVAMFAQMGCALVKGQPKALMQQPCGFVGPLMQSMGEYDLVMVKDGKLFFGDRAGDLTKARPEKLGEFPMVQK
jgi:hypothetical protein